MNLIYKEQPSLKSTAPSQIILKGLDENDPKYIVQCKWSKEINPTV